MKWARAATVLLAAAGAGSLSPPFAPAQARKPVPSLCTAGETVIYSCRFARIVGSVCAGAGRIEYRTGSDGRTQLRIAGTPDWSNVRLGRVAGQQGGHQTHIRFIVENAHYIVFEGVDGQLADRPGRAYSGIVAVSGLQGEDELARLDCPGRATIAPDMIGAVRAQAPEHLRDGLDEDVDGPFEAWF